MSDSGLISIIVPVYNAAKYLRTTIETVRNQTYESWELILVDDCSQDESRDIIEAAIRESSERIRLICLEKNAGAAEARNAGIDAARGRYIAFLDADDIWYPEKLEKELQFLKESGAGFVFTAYQYGDENAMPTGKAVRVPHTLTYREALSRTIIFTSTVLFDTEKIGKDLIHMPKIASEDTATWWQILMTGVTAYGLNEPLVIYRRPGSSLSSNKLAAIKRIWDLYRKIAGLSVPESAWHFAGWAVHASLRRVRKDRA